MLSLVRPSRTVAAILGNRLAHLSTEASTAVPNPQQPTAAARKAKGEGDISSVFPSLSGVAAVVLPQRFVDLKKTIVGTSPDAHSQLIQSWEDLLSKIDVGVREIKAKGNEVIPEVSFAELVGGGTSTKSWVEQVRKRGSVVVRDVVEDEQALGWKQQVLDYVKANPQVKGFPADNKQVFELYWSKAQVEARSHPNLLATQKALMTNLFQADPNALISLNTPLSYADRLRIRLPGDSKFALGPHIDAGSLERWEDLPYRNCYREILQGRWQDHNAWDIGRRLGVNSDLYAGPSACSVFRAFQGWLSLSKTGPSEGTLRVFPLLKEASAYVLLRPFFKPTVSPTDPAFLQASSWTLDLDSPDFPNSVMGCAQELNDITHPHLKLDDGGMVSMKAVRPGDMVFWHGDGIHAVEKNHQGQGDSSVFYIPVMPLTQRNVDYLGHQAKNFVEGAPPPDFPGGVGEQGFVGIGSSDNLSGVEGRRAIGMQAFETSSEMSEGEKTMIKNANALLGF